MKTAGTLASTIISLGPPRGVCPRIAMVLNSHTAASLYGALAGATGDADGWIQKSSDDITNELGLNLYEQEGARRHLRRLGVLEEKMAPKPGDSQTVLWFRLNAHAFDELYHEAWSRRVECSEDEEDLGPPW